MAPGPWSAGSNLSLWCRDAAKLWAAAVPESDNRPTLALIVIQSDSSWHKRSICWRLFSTSEYYAFAAPVALAFQAHFWDSNCFCGTMKLRYGGFLDVWLRRRVSRGVDLKVSSFPGGVLHLRGGECGFEIRRKGSPGCEEPWAPSPGCCCCCWCWLTLVNGRAWAGQMKKGLWSPYYQGKLRLDQYPFNNSHSW